jgi:hypothetical protein
MTTTDVVVNLTLDPRFARLLERQDGIQAVRMGKFIREMPDAELPQYIRDMVLALQAESIEVLDECHWKPWATRKDPDEPTIPSRERYIGEMADVFIFFMNLMLAGNVTMNELANAVDAKQDKNLKRWSEGYDGKSGKCPGCGRAYDDTDVACSPSYCTDLRMGNP